MVKIFADQPIIESSSIITFEGDEKRARLQISRWVASGHLIQLKRGYYLLASQYRKVEPDLRYVANMLVSPSYVSMQYALGYFGLIPEAVAAVTSITTVRPQTITTPIGRFEYRHAHPRLFWGYETRDPLGKMPLQMALPEKALLDLIYLTPGKIAREFFESLRLQHLETINMERLTEFAWKFGGFKMKRALKAFCEYLENEGA